MAAPKEKNFSLIVWVFGWLLAIVVSFQKITSQLNVPFAAFEHLGSSQGESTIEAIVRLVNDRWRSIILSALAADRGGKDLPADHYSVFFDYTNQIHGYEDLFKLFNRVDDFFRDRVWRPIASTYFIDTTPRYLVFRLWDFGRSIRIEEAIAVADREGYRPATLLEALAFVAAKTDLRFPSQIVILGSYVPDEGYGCCVPLLSSYLDERFLGKCRFDSKWDPAYRFLFVRKS